MLDTIEGIKRGRLVIVEDDAAFDFMADIEDADNPKEIISNTIETAIDAHYFETDEGNAVIVAATYVDRQLNGTKFSSIARDEPLDVDTFPDRHPELDFSDLQDKAVPALQKVLDNNSELNKLWAENEEDYPAWRQGIEQLIQRLVQAGTAAIVPIEIKPNPHNEKYLKTKRDKMGHEILLKKAVKSSLL